MDSQRVSVHYQIASYSGTEVVYVHPDAERDEIIAKVKRQLIRKSGGIALPYGSESFKINRE